MGNTMWQKDIMNREIYDLENMSLFSIRDSSSSLSFLKGSVFQYTPVKKKNAIYSIIVSTSLNFF